MLRNSIPSLVVDVWSMNMNRKIKYLVFSVFLIHFFHYLFYYSIYKYLLYDLKKKEMYLHYNNAGEFGCSNMCHVKGNIYSKSCPFLISHLSNFGILGCDDLFDVVDLYGEIDTRKRLAASRRLDLHSAPKRIRLDDGSIEPAVIPVVEDCWCSSRVPDEWS